VDGVACGRRVRKLYLSGRYFGCRHCHELTYASSRESDRQVYAAVRRGLHLTGFPTVRGMSVPELGFALKVIRFRLRQLDRIAERVAD
jgi:hypothetical protein